MSTVGRIEWFEVIANSLNRCSTSGIWASGDEILCETEAQADTIADIIEYLYKAQDEEVLVNTGYYDPTEDERSGETDEYTGWWYVNIQ